MQAFSLLTSVYRVHRRPRIDCLLANRSQPRPTFSETWLQTDLPHPVTRHPSLPKHRNDKGLDTFIQDHMYSAFSISLLCHFIQQSIFKSPLLRVVSTPCLSCLTIRLPRQSLSLSCRIQQKPDQSQTSLPQYQACSFPLQTAIVCKP